MHLLKLMVIAETREGAIRSLEDMILLLKNEAELPEFQLLDSDGRSFTSTGELAANGDTAYNAKYEHAIDKQQHGTIN